MSYRNGGYETQKQGSEIGGTPVTPPFFVGICCLQLLSKNEQSTTGHGLPG